jgi:hypothetical protein
VSTFNVSVPYLASKQVRKPIAPSKRPVVFRPPHWTGEPRPNAKSVPLTSAFPPSDYLKWLVSELGYDKRAAMAALPHSRIRFAASDRRRNGDQLSDGQPLYLETESRRTVVGGVHKAEAVTKIIARHSWTDPYPYAVVRVLCLRQRPSEVAKELGVSRGTLYVYASQIRRELGLQETGEATN